MYRPFAAVPAAATSGRHSLAAAGGGRTGRRVAPTPARRSVGRHSIPGAGCRRAASRFCAGGPHCQAGFPCPEFGEYCCISTRRARWFARRAARSRSVCTVRSSASPVGVAAGWGRSAACRWRSLACCAAGGSAVSARTEPHNTARAATKANWLASLMAGALRRGFRHVRRRSRRWTVSAEKYRFSLQARPASSRRP